MSGGGAAAAARAHRPDYSIALIVAVLLALGLVMLYSVSPVLSQKLVGNVDRNFYFNNQIIYIAAGIVVWVVAAAIPYWRWREWSGPFMILATLGVLALLVPGLSRSANGANRWLSLGPISFQPAELLKPALLVYLAAWMEKHREEMRSLRNGMLPFVLMLGLACFAVAVLQSDMGTMMVVAIMGLGMYFVAGAPWLHLGLIAGVGGGLVWSAVLAFPHRVSRLTTFLHPNSDPLGAGYHINQALIAVGSGGLLGVGLGKSLQIYGYLPEAANDSIFAIIGEEFGLWGSLAVLLLFTILGLRGLQVAFKAPDMFGRLVAAGISIWFLAQAFINIGAMLAVLPLTGIPLPFISYGGTSLILSLFAAGLLFNVSRYTVREGSDEGSSQRRRIGRPRLADSGGR